MLEPVRAAMLYRCSPTARSLPCPTRSEALLAADMVSLLWPLPRIELFTPSYILGPRPAWGWTPTVLEYGGDVVVTLAANTSVASIARVVLMEPGTTTHSLTEATRSQQLAFSVVNSSALQITAPADTFVAPPGGCALRGQEGGRLPLAHLLWTHV